MSEAGFARANIDYGILPRYGLTHLLIACALAGVLLFALGRDIARMPVQARQLYSTLFFDTVVLQATRLISMGCTGLDARWCNCTANTSAATSCRCWRN